MTLGLGPFNLREKGTSFLFKDNVNTVVKKEKSVTDKHPTMAFGGNVVAAGDQTKTKEQKGLLNRKS